MFQWFSANWGGDQTNNYLLQLQKPGAPFLRVLCARRCPERSRRAGIPRLHASMGISVGLEALRMIGRTFPGFHTLFPLVQLFPLRGKFFHSL